MRAKALWRSAIAVFIVLWSGGLVAPTIASGTAADEECPKATARVIEESAIRGGDWDVTKGTMSHVIIHQRTLASCLLAGTMTLAEMRFVDDNGNPTGWAVRAGYNYSIYTNCPI